MWKKILYTLLVLFFVGIIAMAVGVRWFHNMWFAERPNHLTLTFEDKDIDFVWGAMQLEDFTENHTSLLIPVSIHGMSQDFYFQFDTGAPTSYIHGKTLESLRGAGFPGDIVQLDDNVYLDHFECKLGGNQVSLDMLQIIPDYGTSFPPSSADVRVKIGTLGADFLVDLITVIDFKNQTIQLNRERSEWMDTLPSFKPFDFQGRRFMLPALIDEKELQLFYDSGSSVFGLITSKNRYDRFTDPKIDEITYQSNRHGDAIPIHHKPSDWTIEIGNASLPLTRVSYVDMYAPVQHFMTPFTRIGGWLGNKPFIESVMVLDTKKEEFLVLSAN